MSRHLRIWLAVAAALAAGSGGAAEVTTESTSSPRESPRALNGHVFQPSTLVTGPFSTTAFGMATDFGWGEATAPRYDIRGVQIGTRDYTLASYGQGLDLDLRVTPDIALRLAINGLVFSGTTGRGILVAGATVQAAGLIGVIAGKDLSKTTRLSFVAEFGSSPQFSVLVGSTVLRAIQTDEFSSDGLTSKVNRVTGAPGVSFAWAPTTALGLVAEARYLYSRRTSSESSENAKRTGQGVTLAGVVGLDLDPLIRWPIGLHAGYKGQVPVSGGVIEVHEASFGVFYTRRVRLALGLETVWRHGKIRPGVEPQLKSDSAIAEIRLRYYW